MNAAPRDGTVAEVHHAVDEMVEEGTEIVTLLTEESARAIPHLCELSKSDGGALVSCGDASCGANASFNDQVTGGLHE